jgi:hypothetical protein
MARSAISPPPTSLPVSWRAESCGASPLKRSGVSTPGTPCARSTSMISLSLAADASVPMPDSLGTHRRPADAQGSSAPVRALTRPGWRWCLRSPGGPAWRFCGFGVWSLGAILPGRQWRATPGSGGCWLGQRWRNDRSPWTASSARTASGSPASMSSSRWRWRATWVTRSSYSCSRT